MFPHFTFSGTTYQALHRKLTLFCTCVTQIILLALSALCVFVAKKKYKAGKRNRFSHRDKFCHFPFAGAGCHLTPVVKPVTGKQFYPDLSL